MRLILLLTILVICLFPTNSSAALQLDKKSICEDIKTFNIHMKSKKIDNYNKARKIQEHCNQDADELIEEILNYKKLFDYTDDYKTYALLALMFLIIYTSIIRFIIESCVLQQNNVARAGPVN